MDEIFNPPVDIVRLANTMVQLPSGESLQFGQLWQKKPIVAIFLRHFACIACRAHAKQVWSQRAIYHAKGVSIVFVGNGANGFIDGFKDDLGLQEALVLTDPSLECFRAAGFRHGFKYVVQAKTVVNAVKLLKKGHRQTAYSKEAGTHWQMGGVLVLKTNGDIAYHYISESLGDFPEEPHFDTIVEDEKNLRSQTSKILY